MPASELYRDSESLFFADGMTVIDPSDVPLSPSQPIPDGSCAYASPEGYIESYLVLIPWADADQMQLISTSDAYSGTQCADRASYFFCFEDADSNLVVVDPASNAFPEIGHLVTVVALTMISSVTNP